MSLTELAVLGSLERSLALFHHPVALDRIAGRKHPAECDHVGPQERNVRTEEMTLVGDIAKLLRLALVSGPVSAAQ
jgi:hypothetical protein